MIKIADATKRKRMTKQKQAVYDTLCSTNTHPTAEWIYEECRKKLPNIGLGTVYRNLQVLLSEGKIQELNYGKAQSHFDGNADPHYHFVCEKCGRILDIPLEGKGLSQDLLAAVPGKVTGHRLECYGICENCLEKTNH